MTTILALVVLATITYRVMTPEERERALQALDQTLWRLKEYGQPQLQQYRAALRARTSWAMITYALAALNVAVYVGELFDPSIRHSDSIEFVSWGASYGPRTTNGEWWRLLTAIFVHPGLLPLLITLVALLQLGLVLERIVGPLAFLTTYLTAGVFASLANLTWHPIGLSMGASGAVAGLFGLLLVSAVEGWLWRSQVTLPWAAVARLAPMAVIFALYNIVESNFQTDCVVLGAGLLVGLVVAKGLSESPPPTHRMVLALASGLAVTVAVAIPLRGILDIRPEIERIVTLEHRTASNYESASMQSPTGKVTARQLADLIDHSIVPELQAADARIVSLQGARGDDERRISDARRYLQLRSEGWRLRAEGLRAANAVPNSAQVVADTDGTSRVLAESRYRSTMRLFGKAEEAERASMDALNRLQQ